MRLLAIETATEVCGVALATEYGVEYEQTTYLPKKHSEMLVPMIRNLFGLADLSLDDLDGIGISIGPGSFTGLRIGLSTAKGISFSHNLDLLAVPTLAASAWSVRFSTERVSVLHHSHRDQYFCAQYRLGKLPVPEVPPYRDSLGKIVAQINPDIPVVLGGIAGSGIPEELRAREIITMNGVSAAGIAELALSGEGRWKVADPNTLEPDYLRKYQAMKYQNPLRSTS